ncbi:hypothetical protein [Streptomyces sp. CB01881]|uniref:hypothetical protein n=1 Tax=Streptomyces sp. CB01881 TaxID=2078691 RepID=UPI000CDBE83D|nr:hypothetical protein [Streptomyces sp. CB01881]AUY48327.1 hypothetical protein C2142_04390 [Streptomyces sp. CB01881]TYC76814.1 hypothetical protein EH183_04405 [Streptomyces sp. CB01881]
MSRSRSTALRCTAGLLGAGLSIATLTAVPAQAASSVDGTITRTEVMERAQAWLNQHVPYDQGGYYGGYREDCSGFVSMAWHLSSSENTDSLDSRSLTTRIPLSDLQPGDALDNDPHDGNILGSGHVILFDHWVDKAAHKFQYIAEGSRATGTFSTADYLDGGGDGQIGGHPASGYFGLRYNNIAADAPPPAPAPVAAAATAGQSVYNADTKTAEVFAIGTDGVMSHSYSSNGGAWSDWATLGTNYHFTGRPVAVYNPVTKVTEVFAVGTDGVMSHNYNFNGGTWSGWSTLDTGYKFTGSPSAVYNAASNAIELFGIGADGVMSHMYNINGGAWSGWSTMGTFKFAGTPTAVYNADTKTAEVFATGTDGVISHAYSTNGGAWSDWATLGTNYHFTGTPAIAYNPVNKVTEVFAVGTDGVMSHNYNVNDVERLVDPRHRLQVHRQPLRRLQRCEQCHRAVRHRHRRRHVAHVQHQRRRMERLVNDGDLQVRRHPDRRLREQHQGGRGLRHRYRRRHLPRLQHQWQPLEQLDHPRHLELPDQLTPSPRRRTVGPARQTTWRAPDSAPANAAHGQPSFAQSGLTLLSGPAQGSLTPPHRMVHIGSSRRASAGAAEPADGHRLRQPETPTPRCGGGVERGGRGVDALWAHAEPADGLQHASAQPTYDWIDLLVYLLSRDPSDQPDAVGRAQSLISRSYRTSPLLRRCYLPPEPPEAVDRTVR